MTRAELSEKLQKQDDEAIAAKNYRSLYDSYLERVRAMVHRKSPAAMASFQRTEQFLLAVARGEVDPVLPPPISESQARPSPRAPRRKPPSTRALLRL